MRVTTVVCADQGSVEDAFDAIKAAFSRLPEEVAAPTLLRVEARVDGALTIADGLAWSAQFVAAPRVFWADREDGLVVAGVGEAWTLGGLGWTLTEGLSGLQAALATAPARLRAFGGRCFHRELRSRGAWKAFGAWRFAVPRLELGRDEDGVWLAAHVYGAVGDWQRSLAQGRQALADFAAVVRAAAPEDVAAQRRRGHGRSPTLRATAVSDEPSRDGWRRAVNAALRQIEDGPLQKVVLARQRRVQLDATPDAIGLLARLARHEPRTFRFCFQPTAGSAFVGASPERLVRVNGATVQSESLAGTRPRGADATEERRWRAALLASDKDRREHRLVTDMVAETLAAIGGTVSLPTEPNVMALASVQHLHTPIVATLPRTPSIAELLVALHPTPAVGGTPREVAGRAIETLESFQRGLYAAPVGWLGGQGAAEFTVAIRSALVENDAVSFFSGAGIVPGSDPDEEWAEIDGKIAALWQAFGLDGADT